MTKVAFVVQNNYVLHMTIPVAQYVWKTPHTLIDRSSFSDFEIMNCDVDWDSYDLVIPFGSVQFVRNMRGTPIERHMFFREESFHTDIWIKHFGDQALNHGGAKLRVPYITSLLVTYPDDVYHVRPNSKDKAFIANVFTKDSWLEIVGERGLEDELECYISPVSSIISEYRCWIIGGKVTEVSRYRQDDQMDLLRVDKTHDAWIAAQQLADIYLPEQCIVMDIAETADGYKFLEFNCIHSSGWYAGDIPTVFNTLIQWASENDCEAN